MSAEGRDPPLEVNTPSVRKPASTSPKRGTAPAGVGQRTRPLSREDAVAAGGGNGRAGLVVPV